MEPTRIYSLMDTASGNPIIYNGKTYAFLDRIEIPSGKMRIKVTFISTNSNWKQGIIFKTKGLFEIEDGKIPHSTILWEHTAPKEVIIDITSKNKTLIVCNAWDTGKGTIDYWYQSCGMQIEEIDGYKIYNCNDGYPDEDFDDLIFKIEFLDVI